MIGSGVSLKNSFDVWVPTHLTTFYVEVEYIMHAEQKTVAEWSSVTEQKSDAEQDLGVEWYSYI